MAGSKGFRSRLENLKFKTSHRTNPPSSVSHDIPPLLVHPSPPSPPPPPPPQASGSSSCSDIDHNPEPPPTSSDHFRTTRNILNAVLPVLGKAPIPGIGSVVEGLMQALDHLEKIPENTQGWKMLEERILSLTFLLSSGDLNNDFDQTLAQRLKQILLEITESISHASKQSALDKFFNSVDDGSFISQYNTQLTNIVIDVTVFICAKTGRTSTQIQEQLKEFKRDLMNAKDEAEADQFTQRYDSSIKVAQGVVGLKFERGISQNYRLPAANQHFGGSIEVQTGVVGIDMTG